MPAKIVLSITSRNTSIALCDRGALREYRVHEEEAQALASLHAILAQHPDTSIDIMVDTAEEEFRAEQLPRVHGLARREMVQRKLAQFFRTATYRASWPLGPAGDKRGDDIHVFAALSASEFLRPFVEAIQARQAPLAGIYLFAQATQTLVERLKWRGAVLVVSSQQAGLRQSLFLNGRLRISRLAAIDADTVTPQLVAEEIEKSRLFLYNGRVLPRETVLRIVVLDPADQLADTARLVPTEAGIGCEVMGAAKLRSVTGLPADLVPSDAQALHLYLIGRYRPVQNFAPARLIGVHLTHRMRLGLYVASIAIAGIGAIWGIVNLLVASSAADETTSARNQAAHYRAAYEAAARQFPSAPTGAEQMRQAVEGTARLRGLARTPEAFLVSLSQGMSGFPQIELNRIDWKAEAAPETARATAAPGERAEIDAEIRPFYGDYRSALQLIEQFAAALRTRPGMAEVTVAKLPLNLDPGTTLSGSARETADTREHSAKFTLALRWSPAP